MLPETVEAIASWRMFGLVPSWVVIGLIAAVAALSLWQASEGVQILTWSGIIQNVLVSLFVIVITLTVVDRLARDRERTRWDRYVISLVDQSYAFLASLGTAIFGLPIPGDSRALAVMCETFKAPDGLAIYPLSGNTSAALRRDLNHVTSLMVALPEPLRQPGVEEVTQIIRSRLAIVDAIWVRIDSEWDAITDAIVQHWTDVPPGLIGRLGLPATTDPPDVHDVLEIASSMDSHSIRTISSEVAARYEGTAPRIRAAARTIEEAHRGLIREAQNLSDLWIRLYEQMTDAFRTPEHAYPLPNVSPILPSTFPQSWWWKGDVSAERLYAALLIHLNRLPVNHPRGPQLPYGVGFVHRLDALPEIVSLLDRATTSEGARWIVSLNVPLGGEAANAVPIGALDLSSRLTTQNFEVQELIEFDGFSAVRFSPAEFPAPLL